ncbi:MAG: 30S ribosome-binding factor RbfA [Candidatus Margulisiibacteriota bacterium]
MTLRHERMASVIQQHIPTIIRREINSSGIGFISITEVKVSEDFSKALVYYSEIGSDEQKKKTRRALSKASKTIKFHMGRVLQTQSIPHLIFLFDESVERGVDLVNKINALSNADEDPTP